MKKIRVITLLCLSVFHLRSMDKGQPLYPVLASSETRSLLIDSSDDSNHLPAPPPYSIVDPHSFPPPPAYSTIFVNKKESEQQLKELCAQLKEKKDTLKKLRGSIYSQLRNVDENRRRENRRSQALVGGIATSYFLTSFFAELFCDPRMKEKPPYHDYFGVISIFNLGAWIFSWMHTLSNCNNPNSN